MHRNGDPRNFFHGLHVKASGELMQLMEGFYSNIEDGLFELAYANNDQAQQRRAVELMRELRFRREHLLKTFGKRMQGAMDNWLTGRESGSEFIDERNLSAQMAGKVDAHFGHLLQMIAERSAHAIERDVDRQSLPFSPSEISYHFVMSCRSVRFDKQSIALVQSLFARFVLDRLGMIYGDMNHQLDKAGYCTLRELDEILVSSSA